MTIVWDNILGAIGNTPTIRLSRIGRETGCEILVKYEGTNPGERYISTDLFKNVPSPIGD